jgi:phage gp29-like protein
MNNGKELASFLQGAKLVPGMEVGVRKDSGQIDWVAPNMGQFPVAHISTFQSLLTTAARTYRESDEAIRASRDDARNMRNDCGIMECLESRQRCTALLNWHIEPEDDTSQEQKDLAADMTKIMTEICRFTEYRRVLMEAIWYGKYGVQNRFGWQNIGGKWRVLPTPLHHTHNGWVPINGDKIVFRFDDGNLPEGAYPGQMGIRVGLANWGDDKLIANRWKVEATERGMAYFLSEAEQKLCVVHTHMIEDAAYEDAIASGNLHGVGIRSRIYWEWFQKQSSLQFLMEYLERSAGGIELWHYPMGNDKAKEEVKIAATERVSNRNVTLIPIPAGEEGNQYGLQVIEPGMAGIDCLKDLLQTYFGHRIKRYILGQTLTSEADATGLGSGVADLHLDTFLQIIKYDATNLEETLTRQLLRPLQAWNFPKSKNIRLKFRLDTEDVDMQQKLEAYFKAYQMGLAIKAKDVADTIGMSMPGPNDEVLKQQQQPAGGMGALPGMPPDQGPPGAPPADGAPPDQPGAGPTDDQGGDPSQQPDMPSGAPAARYSRGADWTDEDEKKHPRSSDGTFAPKGEGQSGGKAKVKVETKKFGEHWYAIADLPGGIPVTRQHKDEKEAKRLAAEEIRMHGHDVDEGEAEKPVEAPKAEAKPKVKIDLQNFGQQRWYAMADLPNGAQITRSHEDKAEAHRLAAEDVRAAGHEAHEFDAGPKPEAAAKPVAEFGSINGGKAKSVNAMLNESPAALDRDMIGLAYDIVPGPEHDRLHDHIAAVRPDLSEVSTEVRADRKKPVSKPPHEMSQAEYVSADPKVQEARKMLELTRQNTPHNTFAAQEEVDKAEETAKQMHHIEVATAMPDGPNEGDVNPEGLVFRDGRWHRDEVKTGQEPKQGYDSSQGDAHHGIRTSDELAGAGEQNHRGSERGLGEAASGQSSSVPSANDSTTGNAGGTGSVRQGDRNASDAGIPSESGAGNRPSDSNGNGDGRSPETGVGTGSTGRGLGTGSSDGGHRSSRGKAVAKTLRQSPSVENPTDVSAGNWRYHARDFYQGGIKAKFANNLEAIRTMRAMADEGRTEATPAEQEVLSRFVGWGAMPGLFNEHWDSDTAEAYGNAKAGYYSDEYKKWLADKDKWSDERDLIKPLMTDAEWAAARKATLNSHFTHPSVVDAHWKMARKLGFDGGRFLEPSAGIGYYLGLMPSDLAGKTRVSAVELDNTTGNMLAKLYPGANVVVNGFEKQQMPKDFYDLVASNVPFGDFKLSDPEYNQFNANIHDYFFLKSANLTKAGGMVMHVTSTGTMDKEDDKIRRELAKTCDFVAAVRFPEGAHQENAGTQVVTDMVLLRKRYPGEKPVTLDYTPPEAMPPGEDWSRANEDIKERLEAEGVSTKGFTGMTTDSLGRVYHWVDGKRVPAPDWMGVKQVPDPAGGEPITVNSYFADHPEQILGTLDRTGTMYGGKQKNVSKTDDYEERLQAAIDRLPEGVFTSKKTDVEGMPDRRELTAGVKNHGYVIHDGKLYQRSGGEEVEQHVGEKQFARIEGQLKVRDAMQAVIDAELSGEPADEARANLNSVYDAYVKQYGPLSSQDNRSAMGDDPDAVRLVALESTFDKKKKTATKADMFFKPTVRANKRADQANGVVEGVGVCLNETGSINPERIAALTGKTVAEVEGELRHGDMAFEDPETGWQPASLYLSGNVRKKLVMARAAAQIDPKYQHNVDALPLSEHRQA